MLYLVIFILVLVFLVFIQPLLTLVIAWHHTNFSDYYLSQGLSFTTDMTGFAGLPDFSKGDVLLGLAIDGQKTCENGYYIGEKETPNINCSQICNATSNKQFAYKYITSNKVIVNNQYLRRGGWCLPTTLSRCNLNISTAVKSAGHYECVSRFPQLLGGQYGNDIIGCAPNYAFSDNLKKVVYHDTVPSTLVIDNIDERLQNTSEYRYTCYTPKPFASFGQRPDLGNRFQLFYDSCSFFDEGGRLVGDKCECSTVDNNPITKSLNSYAHVNLCSTCTSGFGVVDEKFPQMGSKYGVSVAINCVDPEFIEYYKTMLIDMNGILPCGTKTLLELRRLNSSKRYGCHRALLNVTNSYTPEMLQIIDG